MTMALIAGHSLHETFKAERLPANCGLLWAPAGALGQRARARYERVELTAWATANGA